MEDKTKDINEFIEQRGIIFEKKQIILEEGDFTFSVTPQELT